jgi:ATP-dependent helicase/nuclease subunit A
MDETMVRNLHTLEAPHEQALVSSWISAHAGSGKTKALVDRVLFLLLHDVDPSHILCLTFTKVAAREMTLRVFQVLGEWARCSEAALINVLTDLLGGIPTPTQSLKARQLFAQTLDVPGGLRIETIHGFCERLLRTFGPSASLSAHFRILDEREMAALRLQAKRDVLEKIANHSVSVALSRGVSELMLYTSEWHLDDMVEHLLSDWRDFLSFSLSCNDDLESLFHILSHHFESPWSHSESDLEGRMRSGALCSRDCEDIIPVLMSGSATDQKTAERLQASWKAKTDVEWLSLYRSIFLTQTGNPRQNRGFVSQKMPSQIIDRLVKERDRLALLESQKSIRRACEKTRHVLLYATHIFKRVEELKKEMGGLDFEDLIQKTYDLLMSHEAEWVLYRCDQTLHHILVDEAQDTSPLQWAIIKRLTEEFTAGEGGACRPRTLFVVGDVKQSIYSFQGADPRQFSESRAHFEERHESAFLPFAKRELMYSFRSSPEILEAVDRIFNQNEVREGLLGEHGHDRLKHCSARSGVQGCVEVWPVVQPPDVRSDIEDLEISSALTVHDSISQKITEQVLSWLHEGDPSIGIGPLSPHNILILFRSRSLAFEAVLRSLQHAEIQTAGVDRLALMDHALMRECLALAHAALLPQDDWSLALALRSSLLDWDTTELLSVQARRKENADLSLWEALNQQAMEGHIKAQHAVERVMRWNQKTSSGAFSFFMFLTSEEAGRLVWERAFGIEAHDLLDLLLSFAYTFDHSHIPDLYLFLESCLEWDKYPIKRDLDSDTGVRVMTVHGAKGLEATHVIVVDDGEPPYEIQRGRYFIPFPLSLGYGEIVLPFWASGCGDVLSIQNVRNTLNQEAFSEHMRLLYVALTRARDHLIFAPFSKRSLSQKKDEESPRTVSWPHPTSWTAWVYKGLSSPTKNEWDHDDLRASA